MKLHYIKSCFAVIENTLTDGSKTYDVVLDAQGMDRPEPVYLAVDERDALDRCDRLAAAVAPLDNAGSVREAA